jgi:hypothetical protein
LGFQLKLEKNQVITSIKLTDKKTINLSEIFKTEIYSFWKRIINKIKTRINKNILSGYKEGGHSKL